MQCGLHFISGKNRQIKSDFYNILDNLFIASGEWKPMSLETEEEYLLFNCCPEEFSSITYQFTIDRLPDFYFLYIILPMIALSFLFLLAFFIPPHTGERMSFGISVLLSLTVYMLVVAEKVPENSNTRSMLGTSFTAIIYLLSVGLCFALINAVCTFNTRKPHRYLLMLVSKKNEANPQSEKRGEIFSLTSSLKTLTKSQRLNETNPTQTCEQNHLNEIADINNKNYEEKNYSKEWQQIAEYLDRRCFVLFMALLIIVPIVCSLALPRDTLRD